MPHSTEAEQAVIGSMLLSRDALAAAAGALTGEDFYQKPMGVLFEAMTDLYNEGKEVDLVTLQNRLREMNTAPEISSLEYIRDVMRMVSSSLRIGEYVEIVQEKSQMRRLIRVMESLTNTCYAGTEKAEVIMEETERQIFQVLRRQQTGEYEPVKSIVLRALQKIEAASRNKGNVTGLATGFTDLDYKTSGFQPSDLILVAARPSMGKTAFVLNIAEYMAFRKNQTVALFSLEMSREQLINRLLSMESSVDAQLLRSGNLSDKQWSDLIESAGIVGESKLIIDDTPGISVAELRRRCRKYKLEHNIDIIMIDYLQLMQGSKRADSRQQEISDISRSLKEIAREMQVPVVALSQLSRAVEQRPDHRPMLSDLRESGAIEQDADVVMFLYRDDYYNKDSDRKGIAEVIIAKQRNGPIGTVEVVWLPENTKFANMEH